MKPRLGAITAFHRAVALSACTRQMGPNVGADFSGRPLGRLLQRSNITEGAGRDVEAVEGGAAATDTASSYALYARSKLFLDVKYWGFSMGSEDGTGASSAAGG